MIFAPMSGKELRGRIVSLASRAIKADPRELTSDGKPVASPYDDAKERDERLNASNRATRRAQVQAVEPGAHLSSPT
jgi:gas vesicle protein